MMVDVRLGRLLVLLAHDSWPSGAAVTVWISIPRVSCKVCCVLGGASTKGASCAAYFGWADLGHWVRFHGPARPDLFGRFAACFGSLANYAAPYKVNDVVTRYGRTGRNESMQSIIRRHRLPFRPGRFCRRSLVERATQHCHKTILITQSTWVAFALRELATMSTRCAIALYPKAPCVRVWRGRRTSHATVSLRPVAVEHQHGSLVNNVLLLPCGGNVLITCLRRGALANTRPSTSRDTVQQADAGCYQNAVIYEWRPIFHSSRPRSRTDSVIGPGQRLSIAYLVDICAGFLFYKVCPKAMHTLAQRHLQPPNAMPGLTDLGETDNPAWRRRAVPLTQWKGPVVLFFKGAKKELYSFAVWILSKREMTATDKSPPGITRRFRLEVAKSEIR